MVALTPEQRFAQRRLIGMIRSEVRLGPEIGLAFWRGRTDSEFRTSASDVTDCLDALDIPYVVAVTRGPYKRNRHVMGYDVRVAWEDLDKVVRWMPSLQRFIDAVNKQLPPDS